MERVAVNPASSLHDAGVNAAFGDGSMRFISDDIDRDVWTALGTMSSGESVRF